MPTRATAAEQERLQQAIERLYVAFAAYPLAPHIEGCPHCEGKWDESRLHARPLRELTSEDLFHYAWSALTSWGTVEDFKYFLPRLLELAANEQSPIDEEALFRKLADAHWRSWPIPEQLAVEAYFDALWATVLAQPPEEAERVQRPAEHWLCALAHASSPAELGVYLEYWQTHLAGAAAFHLAQFTDATFQALMIGRDLRGGSWSDVPEQDQVVRRWLASRPLRDAVERAFFEHSEAPEAQALSDALSLLDIYAMSRPVR